MSRAPSSVPVRVKSLLFAAVALFRSTLLREYAACNRIAEGTKLRRRRYGRRFPARFLRGSPRLFPRHSAAIQCKNRPGRFAVQGGSLPFGRNALQQRVQHKPRRARARHHKDGVLLPAPQHEQCGGKQQHGNEVHLREPCGQRVRAEK